MRDGGHTQNNQINQGKSFAPAWLLNYFGIWIPLKLSKKKKKKPKTILDHISKCDCILEHNENFPFLKQIVTGDEKVVLYNNVEWKRSWGK